MGGRNRPGTGENPRRIERSRKRSVWLGWKVFTGNKSRKIDNGVLLKVTAEI